jgi:hypothetical protein
MRLIRQEKIRKIRQERGSKSGRKDDVDQAGNLR